MVSFSSLRLGVWCGQSVIPDIVGRMVPRGGTARFDLYQEAEIIFDGHRKSLGRPGLGRGDANISMNLLIVSK
jgi:hypothetical protein